MSWISCRTNPSYECNLYLHDNWKENDNMRNVKTGKTCVWCGRNLIEWSRLTCAKPLGTGQWPDTFTNHMVGGGGTWGRNYINYAEKLYWLGCIWHVMPCHVMLRFIYEAVHPHIMVGLLLCYCFLVFVFCNIWELQIFVFPEYILGYCCCCKFDKNLLTYFLVIYHHLRHN